MAVTLIKEASTLGCRLKIACNDIGIDFKSYNRWVSHRKDRRHGPIGGSANKLSADEKQQILKVATSPEFVDFSPWIIVSKLADQGSYVDSESSFYKVLKENKMLTHRGKSRPRTGSRPQALTAMSPNQIWSWDITYLPTEVLGRYYFYLYGDGYF